MEITTTWVNDQFNVALSSKPGAEPFLEIKGCRIVDGNDGPFVGWPATKSASTGKWWRHAYGSPKFNAAVLEKAQASQPRKAGSRRASEEEEPGDIPF